jgi:ribosome maturation factor RimP
MAQRSGGSPTATGVEQALTELLEPVLAGQGLVLEELRLSPAGKRRILKVLVDRDVFAQDNGVADSPVEGLSLDEVAEASRIVSTHLDELADTIDPLGGTPYTLEVSSPGVERPLTLPRHFRRNVGRLVELRTADGSSLRCRITSVTQESVTVETSQGARPVLWRDVLGGSVQVEFRRTAAPSAGAADSGAADSDDADDADSDDADSDDADEADASGEEG